MDLNRVETLLSKLIIRDRVSQKAIPFRINSGQRRLHEALKVQQSKKKPMRAIVLKSRRRGISSYTDGLLTCHCLARESTNAMIVTHKYKSSEALFSVPKSLLGESYKGFPPLADVLGIDPMTQHKITFPNNSFLTIATAGTVSGGRGMSLTDLHLSEVAFFPSANSFAALLPTVPRDPDTIVIMESTANGKVYEGEPFYKLWMASVSGDTEFVPIFLGWLDDPVCVDHNRDVSDAPIDDDEEILIKEFGAKPEQLAWRRMMIESPECRGYVDIFNQEYPFCPEVAFIATGDPAFTREELALARTEIKPPLDRGRIELRGKMGEFKPSSNGQLFVWEMPKERCRYYIGADPARGIEDGDFAAFVVFNGDTGEQVARYADRIGPQALAYILTAVGYWYNTAMLNVELTGNLGVWTQKVLRDDIRYPNIYRWKGSRDDKVGKTGSRAIGWETTPRSREMAMTAFREAIRYKVIKIRDEALLAQMDMCTRKDSWARWEIEKGHDDILMAGLIANITRSQWHPAQLSSVTSNPYSEERPLPDKVKAETTSATMWDLVTSMAASNYNEVMKAIKRHGKGKDILEGI